MAVNLDQPTILVIDDEQVLRETLTVYLEDSNYVVYQAADGAAGLTVLSEHRIDLIICDLSMPGMNGLEVLERVKSEHPNIPFIILSGVGVMKDVVEALRLGAWDYLIKPVSDLAVLEHAIGKSLERARLMSENEEYKRKLEITNKQLKSSLERLEEDQEAGRQIQFQLLPESEKEINGFSFSHYIKPSLHLSGDCIDYFQINDDTIIFYLADVSGHGVSSAFVTVLLKSLMEKMLSQYVERGDDTILKPEHCVKQLNDDLIQVKVNKYFTMFYGVLNRNTHELSYTVAGHFPSPILCSDRPPFFLQGTGFPVGMFEWATYQSSRFQLPEAFKMMMFSDGILEILPHKSIEEKEAFLLSLVDVKEISIEAQLNALKLEEVKEPPDDITLLLIEGKHADKK